MSKFQKSKPKQWAKEKKNSTPFTVCTMWPDLPFQQQWKEPLMIMHLMRSLIMAQIFCSHIKSHYRTNGGLQNVTAKAQREWGKKRRTSETVCERHTQERKSIWCEQIYIPVESNTNKTVWDGHPAATLRYSRVVVLYSFKSFKQLILSPALSEYSSEHNWTHQTYMLYSYFNAAEIIMLIG